MPNPLLVPGGVKVTDFGLANFRPLLGEHRGLTRAGVALGTLDFIAPEQVADCRRLDGRADRYGLGCAPYQLLTGRAPLECHDPVSKLRLQCGAEPAPSRRCGRRSGWRRPSCDGSWPSGPSSATPAPPRRPRR